MPVNKFRVLLDVEQGTLTTNSASDLLDMPPSGVLRALASYREHLPYLIEVSNRLSVNFGSAKERKALVEEVAAHLDVTPRQVNRMMMNTGIPVLPTHNVVMRDAKKENAKEKWEIRFDSALSVIAGADRIIDAADICEVSERQMYRWVTRFLKSQGLGIKDMKSMRVGQRQKLAARIEKSEGPAFKIEQEKLDGDAKAKSGG